MGKADVGGTGKQLGPSSLYPPKPSMRDPIKGKWSAPPAVSTEVLLEEDPDVALAQWLPQEKQMAEAVWRGEDPKSLLTAQRLAIAQE